MQEEDEAVKVKFLQDQSHTVQKLDTSDLEIKNSKSKLGSSTASKIVSKLSPKSVHRKRKRRIAKFKVITNNFIGSRSGKIMRSFLHIMHAFILPKYEKM